MVPFFGDQLKPLGDVDGARSVQHIVGPQRHPAVTGLLREFAFERRIPVIIHSRASSDIDRILGFRGYDALVTRDNLVLGSQGNGIDGAHILTPMPYLISTGKVTQNNVPVPMSIIARLNLDSQGISVAKEYAETGVQLDASKLKEAFAAGEDIHARTAMEMFGTVDRDTRGRAKTINFAILYGISRWGLGGRLGVSADEAQAMIDRYFERFPGIQRYIHETLESVRECGYSQTLFGRKTWFPRIGSKNQAERQGSERAAINAPIQGTSADIIKRAMARMMPALAEAGLPNVKMLLQVHDELVFELPEGDVEKAKPVIERVMATAAEPAVKLSVPLGVEIGTGLSWGAAH